MKHLLWLLILPLFISGTHKFYVSNNIVELNTRTNMYEVTCKIFTDDLEAMIQPSCPQPIKLGSDQEYTQTNGLILFYLNKHFKIKINDNPVYFSWVGKNVAPDLTEVFMEFSFPDAAKSINIENNVLMEIFPEQKNIIDLRINGIYTTMILTKEHPSDTKFR